MSTQQSDYFDVVIIGCGPGGSTLAAYLARAGVSVLALEKEAFPRYHIGESLTGMAANVINDFGLGPEMTRRQFPPKGGVKVIGREARNEFFVPVLQPTWQVRRDEFDQILLENAVDCGATHRDGVVTGIIRAGERVIGVDYLPDVKTAGRNDVEPRRVYCRVLADASGRAAVLSRQKVAGPLVHYDEFTSQVAIFTQVREARRDPGEMGD